LISEQLLSPPPPKKKKKRKKRKEKERAFHEIQRFTVLAKTHTFTPS
jgi:hypothetical protein